MKIINGPIVWLIIVKMKSIKSDWPLKLVLVCYIYPMKFSQVMGEHYI